MRTIYPPFSVYEESYNQHRYRPTSRQCCRSTYPAPNPLHQRWESNDRYGSLERKQIPNLGFGHLRPCGHFWTIGFFQTQRRNRIGPLADLRSKRDRCLWSALMLGLLQKNDRRAGIRMCASRWPFHCERPNKRRYLDHLRFPSCRADLRQPSRMKILLQQLPSRGWQVRRLAKCVAIVFPWICHCEWGLASSASRLRKRLKAIATGLAGLAIFRKPTQRNSSCLSINLKSKHHKVQALL